MNIFGVLKARGFDTVPEGFYKHIAAWESWYKGDVANFHRYKVFNGQKQVACRRYSLGMAKKVAEDWADLLMNEKVSVTLEGEAEQAFFDRVCRENNFAVKISEMQERKAAMGTAAYVLRAVGFTADPDTGALTGPAEGIRIDYCAADVIYPLSWENGVITECAFASRRTVGNEKYLYLQLHRREKGLYVIENALFRDRNGSLEETTLSSVADFAHVPARVETGSDRRQFVIDRMNIANNLDEGVPMGVSVYANAIDQLKGVDVAYDGYVNEFVLGKKRIMVRPEAVRNMDGEPVFDPNDTVFYVLPGDGGADGKIVTPIDMQMRTEQFTRGIQDMLNTLGSKVGFGENRYRYDNGSVATATQVVSENSAMFRAVKKHEIILELVLKELAGIILRMGNAYMHAGLNEDVEMSVDFDDSIIVDKEAEFNKTLQLLNAGLLNDWEARARLMNEDDETAKKMLPGAEQLTTEEQDEVE